MTIAIVLKVGDGVVIGADSATTLTYPNGEQNVYFNGDKIVNLSKGYPIGIATYGLGALDGRSISTLAKDLRHRFSGYDKEWRLDPSCYTMEWVAGRVRAFFYDELYKKEYPIKVTGPGGEELEQHGGGMGFIIAGYGAGQRQSEVWCMEIDPAGACTVRCICTKEVSGWADAKGQPEPLQRLVNGYSPGVRARLIALGATETAANEFFASVPMEPLVSNIMPLQDAIDLVRFLAEVTEGWARFKPGHPTVHSPIDIAAITQHEGFRWVQRKHYYTAELNPPRTRHLRTGG